MHILRNSLVGILSMIAIASVAHTALPIPGMEVVTGRTALLITGPQNDFLSPNGVTWGVVGKGVEENDAVANIVLLLKTAKRCLDLKPTTWCCSCESAVSTKSSSPECQRIFASSPTFSW